MCSHRSRDPIPRFEPMDHGRQTQQSLHLDLNIKGFYISIKTRYWPGHYDWSFGRSSNFTHVNATADGCGVLQDAPILELYGLGSIRWTLSIRDGEVIRRIPWEFDNCPIFGSDDNLHNEGNGQWSKEGRRKEGMSSSSTCISELAVNLHQWRQSWSICFIAIEGFPWTLCIWSISSKPVHIPI